MPPISRRIFRESLLVSGLASAAVLDEALAALRREAVGPPLPDDEVEDDVLARKLVQQGVITSYQAEQLKAGRTKLNLGPYLIKEFIGQGGMGHVFKGEHTIMGREVAVKVLPKVKSTPDAIASFTREIRTQASLDHPQLVRAYDAGHDGNVYYLVCEYVPGTDLRRLVREQGPLTMQQAAKIIRQTALALDYAHKRGLIHRDVKPGNILVTPDGTAKVSDLGLVGCLADDPGDPRSGKIVGTADYLAPEQFKSPANISPVSDIYSLGCTLYYAVSGKVPFPGGGTRDKVRRHCEETPWHPRRFQAELSEEFVEVIADMMEKDPQRRVQTAAEVAARLELWAHQASPMALAESTKSPWMSPPPPSGIEDELDDTDDGGYDEPVSGSQPSDPNSSLQATPTAGGQETAPLRRAPPQVRPAVASLPSSAPPPPIETEKIVWRTLMVAVPVSALAGALLMFFLLWLLW